MPETLKSIIANLWIAPEDAAWTPKTDTRSLGDLRRWFNSEDIEVLGFANAMIHDARFRIEPQLTPDEYGRFVMLYYGRCLKENRQGTWADSRYSAGNAVVDDQVRTAIVTACLEHLFEHKDIRAFFSDWKRDPSLSGAYAQACEWYKGGGKITLGRPASGPQKRPPK